MKKRKSGNPVIKVNKSKTNELKMNGLKENEFNVFFQIKPPPLPDYPEDPDDWIPESS